MTVLSFNLFQSSNVRNNAIRRVFELNIDQNKFFLWAIALRRLAIYLPVDQHYHVILLIRYHFSKPGCCHEDSLIHNSLRFNFLELGEGST